MSLGIAVYEMLRRWRRMKTAFALCMVFVSLSCCSSEKPGNARESTLDLKADLKVRRIVRQGDSFQILVSQGSPEEAARYAQHIKVDLGIELNANLDSIITFCGYDTISGRDIETRTSEQLMKQFPDDLVSSRFFAPKIIDVSDVGRPANQKALGWRKVVRLRVKPGSKAAQKGITAMFLLFNVFQERVDVAKDPYSPCIQDSRLCSDNNQVMLVVGKPTAGKDSAYWLVFKNAAVDGGERTDNLPATFDGGEFPVSSPDAVKRYYLPTACAECHGGSAEHAKLNYLDSDHWNDRIQDDDDFAILRTSSKNGVLFDASTGVGDAFSALKTLNTEISEQNSAAGGPDFALRAVKNWLKLHETNVNFISPIDRAIPASSTNPNARVWSRQNPNDEALLKLLNRFCYRCHSSVIYHVFDKEAVFQKKDDIDLYVTADLMPQDRKMDRSHGAAKADLLRFVKALQ